VNLYGTDVGLEKTYSMDQISGMKKGVGFTAYPLLFFRSAIAIYALLSLSAFRSPTASGNQGLKDL